MNSTDYLLAGQISELERLQLQCRVWEPSGRRLLTTISAGRDDIDHARAFDVGCGVLGWLRLLSEWVGPEGTVTGTDIDDAMLTAAATFVTEAGLGNVSLVNDDLFASQLARASFDLVQIDKHHVGRVSPMPIVDLLMIVWASANAWFRLQ
jgi:predicted RNA methylase